MICHLDIDLRGLQQTSITFACTLSHGRRNTCRYGSKECRGPYRRRRGVAITFLYFFPCECAHSSVKSSQTSGLNVWIRSATGNAIANEACVPACPPPNFSLSGTAMISPRSTNGRPSESACYGIPECARQRRLPHCWCKNEHIRDFAARCRNDVFAQSTTVVITHCSASRARCFARVNRWIPSVGLSD